MADPSQSILNMGQEMNPLGVLAGNQFGGDSVLGLQDSMPMPSTLNRVGAIIGGQEDPAVKQQAVNLQTMATVATIRQHQQELLAKRASQFNEILKNAKDFIPFIPEAERPKLAKNIAERAKEAGHPLNDESAILAYLNKPEDGALAMDTFSKAIAKGMSPDAAITEALKVTSDPELRKQLLTGFFQLAGKKQTPAEAALAALNKGAPLPGMTLEETKKVAGGYIEDKSKETPAQKAQRQLNEIKVKRYQQMMDVASDPKATTGQLSMTLNSLDRTIPEDVEEQDLIKQARKNILEALAKRPHGVSGAKKILDAKTAQGLMTEAGNDPAAATQLAKERGFTHDYKGRAIP